MADSPHETEQWLEKTAAPIGVDLTQAPPEMRYQLLQGRVFTIQLFPGGDVAKGELSPADLDFELQGEGWYDGFGKFLGDDPQLPEWE